MKLLNWMKVADEPTRLGSDKRNHANRGLIGFCLLLCCGPFLPVYGYVFLSPPSVWPNGNIPMDLQLSGPSTALIDGNTSWKTVAENALATWNLYVYTVKFTVLAQSPKAAANGDGINQVFFASTVYGQAFGTGVLATTTTWTIGGTRTEGDTIFNSPLPWNSYRGPLRPAASGGTLNDFLRVATHEFGHTLGLDHPDHAGQFVVALMNSTISDLDSLAPDDIVGISALYPGGLPPSIVAQPQSQTVIVGASVTFSVSATGVPPPDYQWYFNGALILNATGPNLTVFNVQPSSAGSYSVWVFNSHGSVTSQAAVLTVRVGPPVILSQPASQVVAVGGTATFSVTASGPPPLRYQWRRNAVNISGATNASYVISGAQASQAGSYTVVVRNDGGAITSTTAVLTVQAPPSITTQPQSKTVRAGSNATFTVAATGTAPLKYKWFRSTSAIAGATSSSYTITGAQPTDAGDYKVTVSNNVGSVDSAVASLIVQYAPRITVQPQSQAAKIGENVTFAVVASAVPAPTYQWKFGSSKISGATSDRYTLTNFQPTNVGSYSVTVSNSVGTVISSNATLAVAVCVPAPTGLVGWWPGDGSAAEAVHGNAGALLNGATVASGKVGQAFSFDGVAAYVRVPDDVDLHLTNGLTIEAWIYPTSIGAYHNIVSKWGVTDSSQTAYTTTVLPDGRVGMAVSASGDAFAVVGTSSTNSVPPDHWTHFAATYDGSALRTYVNGICEDVVAYNQGIFPGTEALAIGAAGAYAAGQVLSPFAGLIDEPSVYNRALSASEIASIYKASSTGKCALPPAIEWQPSNQIAIVGQSAVFTLSAVGSPPLSYQWQLSGSIIPGATGTACTVSNAQRTDSGGYVVVVTNTVGSVTSDVATLTVGIPPRILVQLPRFQTIIANQSASLTVIAEGDDLHYQWFFFWPRAIPGETNATLTLTNPVRNDEGRYYVQITNAFGSAYSLTEITVIVRQRLSSPRSLPGGGFQFLSGYSDGAPITSAAEERSFEAQFSSNFQSWVTLSNSLFSTNGQLLLRDKTSSNAPVRFYRIIQHY